MQKCIFLATYLTGDLWAGALFPDVIHHEGQILEGQKGQGGCQRYSQMMMTSTKQ